MDFWYGRISKKNNDSLLVSKHKINKHSSILRSRKIQAILDNEMISRSRLRTISQQARESIIQAKKSGNIKENEPTVQHTNKEISATLKDDKRLSAKKKMYIGRNVLHDFSSPLLRLWLFSFFILGMGVFVAEKNVKVGDTVNVSSLGLKATVLKLDTSKGDILVQTNKMKLKLKLSDVERQKVENYKYNIIIILFLAHTFSLLGSGFI